MLPKPRLVSFLRDTFPIESRTIRAPWFDKGQPVFGYVGIRFDEGYLALLAESSDDESDSNILHQAADDEEDAYDAESDDWSPDFVPSKELVF